MRFWKWFGSFVALAAVIVFSYFEENRPDLLDKYWYVLVICFFVAVLPILKQGGKKDGLSFKGMKRGKHRPNVWTRGRRPMF